MKTQRPVASVQLVAGKLLRVGLEGTTVEIKAGELVPAAVWNALPVTKQDVLLRTRYVRQEIIEA